MPFDWVWNVSCQRSPADKESIKTTSCLHRIDYTAVAAAVSEIKGGNHLFCWNNQVWTDSHFATVVSPCDVVEVTNTCFVVHHTHLILLLMLLFVLFCGKKKYLFC